jgi:hypothetical protein
MNKEVRWNKNTKKTRVQKSRDTVPLIVNRKESNLMSVVDIVSERKVFKCQW